MIWVQLAVALLGLINTIVSKARERELLTEGQRQEIARQSLAIAAKVRTRDQIRKQVDAMSDEQVDAGLRELEPK